MGRFDLLMVVFYLSFQFDFGILCDKIFTLISFAITIKYFSFWELPNSFDSFVTSGQF